MVSHFRHKVKPFFNFFFTFFWRLNSFAPILKGATHEVAVAGSVDFNHVFSLTHRNRIAQKEEDVNTYFSSRKSLSIKDLARGGGAAGPKSLTVSNLERRFNLNVGWSTLRIGPLRPCGLLAL